MAFAASGYGDSLRCPDHHGQGQVVIHKKHHGGLGHFAIESIFADNRLRLPTAPSGTAKVSASVVPAWHDHCGEIAALGVQAAGFVLGHLARRPSRSGYKFRPASNAIQACYNLGRSSPIPPLLKFLEQ
jgi:hypothetical protein